MGRSDRMNLRHSRFKDDWKKLFARPYSCRLKTLTTSGLACISDGEMQLPSGPLAIIGGNGVGKSTLALAVAELLDPENVAWGLHTRLVGSSSRADGESGK